MTMTYHTTRHRKRKHILRVKKVVSETNHNNRIYRLLVVETQDGLEYICLRLHNANNHFIKQFLFEQELLDWLIETLLPFRIAA